MSTSMPDSSSDLITTPGLGAVLRNRWQALAIGLAVGLVLGVWMAIAMPTRYQASSTVRVGAGVISASDLSDTTVSAVTQAQIAALRPSLQRVADRIDVPVASVRENLSVSVREDTSLIDFTYSATDPEEAVAGANAASETYLQHAQNTARAQKNERIALLQRQLRSATPGQVRRQLSSELRTLQSSIIDFGTMASTAEGGGSPSLMRPPLYILAGALAGLLLGAFAAVLIQAARPTVLKGVPVGGINLLGHIEGPNPKSELRSTLVPALSRVGDAGLGLVPVGMSDMAIAQLRRDSGTAQVLHLDNEKDYALAARAGGVILVVATGSPIADLREVKDHLQMVDATLLGMVSVLPGAWTVSRAASPARQAARTETPSVLEEALDHGAPSGPGRRARVISSGESARS